MPPKIQRIECPEIPAFHDWLVSVSDALKEIVALRVEPPLQLKWDGGPPVISLPSDAGNRRWFKLTANSGGGQYTGTEVYPSGSGGWTLVPSGITPTLWEVNLFATIALSPAVYVLADRMPTVNEWRFQLGGCS